jgi:rhodanese-related sulfurtransferase
MKYKQATRESGLIICVAVFLGFSYTVFAGKGFFGIAETTGVPHRGVTGAAPTPINLQEAKTLFDSNGALFVDARHPFDFRRGHIRSAINIPLSDFDSRQKTVAALPKDKVIIVYCDESECNSSIELAAKMYEDGIGGVRIFFGGWQEWLTNKFPIESSP